jgi:hypothetical protein
MQFSTASWYFLPLRSKYSPQYPVFCCHYFRVSICKGLSLWTCPLSRKTFTNSSVSSNLCKRLIISLTVPVLLAMSLILQN